MFDGFTPLIKAVQEGDLRKVEALVAAGADVNARDRKGWTAFLWAVNEDNLLTPVYREIMRVLEAAGADRFVRAYDGTTELHLRAAYSRPRKSIRFKREMRKLGVFWP